jgi:hypothetical protein
LLVELELVDPYLALDLAPHAARALAQTVSASAASLPRYRPK